MTHSAAMTYSIAQSAQAVDIWQLCPTSQLYPGWYQLRRASAWGDFLHMQQSRPPAPPPPLAQVGIDLRSQLTGDVTGILAPSYYRALKLADHGIASQVSAATVRPLDISASTV